MSKSLKSKSQNEDDVPILGKMTRPRAVYTDRRSDGLAQKGVSSDRYSELHEKIQSLETKVRKLEEDICKKNLYISDLTDSYISEIMNAMVIEYERG